jgi:phosphatidylglycerol lysyltransferase
MVGGAAAHALCHVLGWHAVLGAAVRRRAYADHAARPVQLAGIMLAVGTAVLAGAVLMFAVSAASLHAQSAAWWIVAGLLVLSSWGSRKARTANERMGWGRLGIRFQRTAAILPLAALEALAALSALWVLVPAGTYPDWSTFVLACLLAQAAGVASHVPGGIGVFEAAMLASAPAESRAGLLAAILAYRAVYGLLPFVVIGLPWAAWSLLHPSRPQAAQLETG